MVDSSRTSSKHADWRDSVTWYNYQTNLSRFIYFIGTKLFLSLAELELVDPENVPASGRCVVAANHISGFDVFYLPVATPRYCHFMAKMELYKNPILAYLLRQLGSFPVKRGENDAWALRQAGHILSSDKTLVMFPEGTRSRKAQLRRGKVGAVRLALEHKAPIIPVAITGTENIGPGLKRANKVRVQFDEPLDVTALAGPPPHGYDTLRELTSVLMKRIAAMLPPSYRGRYG